MLRYHGLDVHKAFVYLCIQDATGSILREERLDFGPAWEAYVASLTADDAVVLEASTQAFDLHDELAPQAGRVEVAHPTEVRLIAKAHFKSDRLDAQRLAHLLRLDYIPQVWVPPADIRALRAVLAQRQALQQDATRHKNGLHALLHRHGLIPPWPTCSVRPDGSGCAIRAPPTRCGTSR